MPVAVRATPLVLLINNPSEMGQTQLIVLRQDSEFKPQVPNQSLSFLLPVRETRKCSVPKCLSSIACCLLGTKKYKAYLLSIYYYLLSVSVINSMYLHFTSLFPFNYQLGFVLRRHYCSCLL